MAAVRLRVAKLESRLFDLPTPLMWTVIWATYAAAVAPILIGFHLLMHLPKAVHFSDALTSALWDVLGKQPSTIIVGVVSASAFVFVIGVAAWFRDMTRGTDHGGNRNEFTWFYWTLCLVGCYGAGMLWFVHHNPDIYLRNVKNHRQLGVTLMRAFIMLVLLALAGCVYVVKNLSLALYGSLEITLAILGNFSVISGIHVDGLPLLTFQDNTTDPIKLCAFAYLLSKGLANVVEGVNDRLQPKRNIETEES